jgi:hypothetical protein
MPLEPEIKMLSSKSRGRFFLSLLTIFVIALPAFIFYTSGYRLDFSNQETTIYTTGGMYVTTENLDVSVFIDTEEVQRPRLFRSAYYIQNIAAGSHRVVVQQPGLHTWVKKLPVDPYIVTEASAFNMPVVPHIRPISEFVNANGEMIFYAASTTSNLFEKATTTEQYLVLPIPARASTTLTKSEEHIYVRSLFATTTATTTEVGAVDRISSEIERFRFSTTSTGDLASSSTSTPIVYVERGNMRLVEDEAELFATWVGTDRSTPYYFCTADLGSTTVALRLGSHVADQIEAQRISTSTPLVVSENRVCRTTIRIDRKWQKIVYYKFFPGSSDLIVLQLEDGLYVTEVDDRAWQNTQLIYPGNDFKTVVTDTNLYIEEDGRYFELLTRIEPI